LRRVKHCGSREDYECAVSLLRLIKEYRNCCTE